ncbi:putative BRCT domain-containing protein [Helianthus annuus]|nr:putative BRCT domain-containing protein [Helianthus annuus]
MENHQNSPFDRPSQVFNGIRFVLLGYDPLKNSQDDPVCVAARRDGKILVSSLWADHSFDVGAPVDVTSVSTLIHFVFM